MNRQVERKTESLLRRPLFLYKKKIFKEKNLKKKCQKEKDRATLIQEVSRNNINNIEKQLVPILRETFYRIKNFIK